MTEPQGFLVLERRLSPRTRKVYRVVRNQSGARTNISLWTQGGPRFRRLYQTKDCTKAMETNSSCSQRCRLRMVRAGFTFLPAILGIVAVFHLASPVAAELAQPINPPLTDVPNSTSGGVEKAVFAGGCFWGIQAVFQHTKGVTSAVSGYAGGTPVAPSYEQVSSGKTGHAESVEVTFDPTQISYGHLLQIYFSVAHDPTQLNGQGPDEGTQYRSEIFATSDAQQRVAETYIAELDKAHAFAHPIVTKVELLKTFYRAEPYHQDYATLHPSSTYIVVYDLPKVANLKKLYPDLYREQPVLVSGKRE
jgi:peptide-methionine (S)-S-oxide reductase